MKLFKKHAEDILNGKYDIIAYPACIYNIQNKIWPATGLSNICKMFRKPLQTLVVAKAQRIIDAGDCYMTPLKDNINIAFLLNCYCGHDIDNNEDYKKIDYELLYKSLTDLLKDSFENHFLKIAFFIDDFILFGCNIDILESMIRSIFGGYDFTITFIYGK